MLVASSVLGLGASQKLPQNLEFSVTRVQYLYFNGGSAWFFICLLSFYLLVQANTNKVPKVAVVLEPSVPRQLISGNRSREIQFKNLNALYFCSV